MKSGDRYLSSTGTIWVITKIRSGGISAKLEHSSFVVNFTNDTIIDNNWQKLPNKSTNFTNLYEKLST